MHMLPKISIITSSYNQGHYIDETIQSVIAQNYPNVEHIVVDGMSTDNTVEVLSKYTHLKVIREPDKGQADAINKGFRAATGDILCFLNSDDTLYPGTFDKIIQVFRDNPTYSIVMGRCRFIDEHGKFIGIEHPSAFESHKRVLEIWKGYTIPQPAVFWKREVIEKCGLLNEQEQLMLDYELFCRYSKEYSFFTVDQLFATYRLHTQSKTNSITDDQRLEQAIQVSKRFWGAPYELQFWQILVSYLLFRFNRRTRAVSLFKKGKADWLKANYIQAVTSIILSGIIAPDVAVNMIFVPIVRKIAQTSKRFTIIKKILQKPYRLWKRYFGSRDPHPQTLAWRDFVGVHPDKWVGPTFITEFVVSQGQTNCSIDGDTSAFRFSKPLELELFVDNRKTSTYHIGHEPVFHIEIPMSELSLGQHELKIIANTFVVPFEILGVEDYRPLVFRLNDISWN